MATGQKYVENSIPLSLSPRNTHTMYLLFTAILLISFFLIYRWIKARKLFRSVTNRNRGTKTERKLVSKLLKTGYPAQTIFHDLYLRMGQDRYAQIDLVLATKVGLVVFEVKAYSGWIYGTGFQPKWTQVLNYGKEKYRFYNPLLQNKRHVQAMRKHLGDATFPIYSVVVFFGDCVFKDIEFIPEGSFLIKSERILDVLKRIIKGNPPTPYTPQNKKKIVQVLKEGVRNGESKEVREGHELRIRDMLERERVLG